MRGVVGVDPGQSGGVAWVDDDGCLLLAQRTPLVSVKGGRRVVDAAKVLKAIQGAANGETPRVVVIERAQAMPKQGASSAFNYGASFGAMEAVALMLVEQGSAMTYVSPAQWKRDLGLSSSKRASLDLARLTFGASPLWEILANDGIAEAALIAQHHRDHHR